MTVFTDAVVLRALGWGLFHFLWQGMLLWLIAAVVLRLLASGSARSRHAVAMLAMSAAPLLLIRATYAAWSPMRLGFDPSIPTALVAQFRAVTEGTTAIASGRLAISLAWLDARTAWITLAWLLGSIAFGTRLATGWRMARREVQRHTVPATALMDRLLASATLRLGRRRRVRMLAVRRGASPGVAGWWRPVILVPLAIPLAMPPLQLEQLIAHELAHIQRRDYLWNAVQGVIEVLFFFHPAIWWLSNRARIERELACDDMVLAAYRQPVEYGSALLGLAEIHLAQVAVLSAGSQPLLERVSRMFAPPTGRAETSRGAWVVAATVLPLLLVTQLSDASWRVREMLGATLPGLTLVERHAQHNAHFRHSDLTVLTTADGHVVQVLRLGDRLAGIRFVVLSGRDDGPRVVVVDQVGWRGSTRRVLDASSSDLEGRRLLAALDRETALDVNARVDDLMRANGVAAVLDDVDRTGSAFGRAATLGAALRQTSDPADRALLLERVGGLRDANAARVILEEAIDRATTPDAVAAALRVATRLRIDAETEHLLLHAIGSGAVDARVAREILAVSASIPSLESRGLVRGALRRAT
ncbi:MAG: M56 family metallopeptidase [Gemmatimonadota bacterium]